MRGNTAIVSAVLLLAAACSRGGGGSGPGGGNPRPGSSLYGNLQVRSTAPADGATGVATTAQVRVYTDGVVVSASLQDPGSHLSGPGGTVSGTFSLEDAGRTIVFTPAAPLERGADYTLHLSPLTCDTGSRILDDDLSIGFRTLDNVPPAVLTASPPAGQVGVARSTTFLLQLSEPVLPASVAGNVALTDAYGRTYAVDTQVASDQILVAPRGDLPGAADCTLHLQGGGGGIRDMAGNPLGSSWTLPFRTAADTQPPAVLKIWPSTSGVSPNAAPVVVFDESVDPASVEPSSVQLTDQFGSFIAFDAATSTDGRRLRLQPRQPLVTGRTYAITVAGGANGVTDLSGNPTPIGAAASFSVGADTTPPAVQSTSPAAGAARVSLNARPLVVFDEPIDPGRIGTDTVKLWQGSTPVRVSPTIGNAGNEIRVITAADLLPDTSYTLQIVGGADGLRDLAGNTMPADHTFSFQTSEDPTLPTVLLAPYDGNAAVPTGVSASATFDEPVDPATVGPGTVWLVGPAGSNIAGTISLERGDRVIRFQPGQPWVPGNWYTFVVAGGEGGVREATGNWLATDQKAQFRIGFTADATAPAVTVSLNQAAQLRVGNMNVPAAGFEIEVTATDLPHRSLDMSSTEVHLTGTGVVPGPEAIFATATVDGSRLVYRLPAGRALAAGDYAVHATVRDLSGNEGTSLSLPFRVEAAQPAAQPFERTQVVWVRFDLDRDNNGVSDLEDDLLRLGLIAPGDPLGANARMLATVQDGILAQTHAALGRGPGGQPLGPDAVPLRLIDRQPAGLVPAQIACGGLDPTGDPTRTFGSQTTGTLGRAFFDHRNADMADVNTATSPGLGVFPGELFLFEAGIHQQTYPTFTTSFSRAFVPLVPAMGGTPAGEHLLDPVVLSTSFGYATATAQQQLRYDAIFQAADDWSTAVGLILAHEIGHTVGLVAQGPSPGGLHGDSSLHNEVPGATDIMAAAVSYDALVSLAYEFRDLNIAYLRQILLLR